MGRIVTVALSPELADFVDGKVADGDYQSVDEVVSAALALMREHDEGLRLFVPPLRRAKRQASRSRSTSMRSLRKCTGAPRSSETCAVFSSSVSFTSA